MAELPELNELVITAVNLNPNFSKDLKSNKLLTPKKYTDLGIVDKKNISRVGTIIEDKARLKKLKVLSPKSGFKFDEEDTKDKNWYPQGISYIEEKKNTKTIVISWYHKKTDYARITFVKPIGDKVEYNHVTLVQADCDTSYKAIETHAGGIAIIGNYIYVADSTLGGVRVFNANVLFEITEPADTECGIVKTSSALGHRYIIPEVCHYKLKVGISKMSFMSVDRSDPKKPRLLTGNFTSTKQKKYKNGPSLVALWEMKKEKSGFWGIHAAEQIIGVFTRRGQGAVKFKDDLLINRSYSDESHSIRIGTVVDDEFVFVKPKTSNWPVGCEDLAYDDDQSELWGVTEFPDGTNGGYRFVYCANFGELIIKNSQ